MGSKCVDTHRVDPAGRLVTHTMGVCPPFVRRLALAGAPSLPFCFDEIPQMGMDIPSKKMLSPHEISTLLILRHSSDTSAVGVDRLLLLEELGLIEHISVDGSARRAELTAKGIKVLGELERF